LKRNYIKINNLFFSEENKIDIDTFSIYCYLLTQRSGILSTSLKIIHDVTQLSIDTIVKGITILHNENIIDIQDFNNKIKVSDVLIVNMNKQISNPSSKYFVMSVGLYYDYIKVIKSKGWKLLCLLSKYHNYEYKTTFYPFGYSFMSLDKMSLILSISQSTVQRYIKILKNNKLIKTYKQKSQCIGQGEFENYSNICIANNRIRNNKYYLSIFDKFL
jgi:hypothetical protein